MLSQVTADDFVWSAISSVLSGPKRGSNGAQMINCPMCVTRGETPDKRHRCGVTRRENGMVAHCYNCGFATEFKIGETLSKNMQDFMEHLGVPETEIKRINFKALQYKRMITISPEAQVMTQSVFKPNFPTVSLPQGCKKISDWANIDTQDQDFIDVASYLLGRGDELASYDDFYWTPKTERNLKLNRRLIIPFTYQDKIVGWSGRLIDQSSSNVPKYWSVVPPNYLYNNHRLETDSKYVIVVEGVLDAKAVGGVATLGAKLSDDQARWLRVSQKTVIVVADRDRSGQRLIDHALENDWMVGFPKLKDGHGKTNWWSEEVKDCADATKKYGKLYTIRSIVETATANKIEIQMKRKLLF